MRFSQNMIARFSSAVALLLLLSFAGGCVHNTSTVTKGMANEGYAIWYPAESGLEPGQIWLYNGVLSRKFADRPDTLPLTAPRPAHLSIEGLNDAEITLSSEFTSATISKAGLFASELDAGTVKTGTFKIDAIEAVDIDLGPSLLDSAAAKYGPGYAKALELVRNDTPGLVLIAGVLHVQRVEYVLYCEDPYKLIERLPRIRDMIHADVETQLLNDHEIRVTLTPVHGALTLAVTPVRGDRLQLTTDQARAAFGHDLMYAEKQSYALRTPTPNLVFAPGESVISPTDSQDDVMTKYRRAITPATRPAIATAR